MKRKKIYLVGSLYDDFCSGGFYVKGVASTKEKARIMKQEYIEEEECKKYPHEFEIREWDIDTIHPVAKIEKSSLNWKGIFNDRVDISNYNVIEDNEEGDD